jgi:hypothetical protein
MTPTVADTAVAHHVDLTECHCLSLQVPEHMPPSGPLLSELRQRAWSELLRRAFDWARDERVDIVPEPFERSDDDGTPVLWGVSWTVAVGRGQENTPGSWTWNDRWRTWLSCFRLMDRPRLRLITGTVTPLRSR